MDNIIAENLLLVCSICLDYIADYKERSVAKLKCGHQFHLDCIGSAFNVKGAMVCPNCGDTETGSWLYGNDSATSLSNSSIDDEYVFAEDPFGFRWFPFSGLTGGHLSFEQVESSSAPNRELLGNHEIFAEHMAASPLASSHVHVSSIPSAISANVQYQSWGIHSTSVSADRNHLSGANHASVPLTLRTTRVDALPFLFGDTSFPRGGSSFVSSLYPPGSIPMGIPLLAPVLHSATSSVNIFPHSGTQILHEENMGQFSRFVVMSFDRDSGLGSERQAPGGADPSGSGNFWP